MSPGRLPKNGKRPNSHTRPPSAAMPNPIRTSHLPRALTSIADQYTTTLAVGFERATANHALQPGPRALRIDRRRDGIGVAAVPVGDPFPDVADHVVRAERAAVRQAHPGNRLTHAP